jgi:hypothetical protein
MTISWYLRPVDRARAHAWICHNIEEMGPFERFLPARFAREANRSQPD